MSIPIMACPITDAGGDQKQDYYTWNGLRIKIDRNI